MLTHVVFFISSEHLLHDLRLLSYRCNDALCQCAIGPQLKDCSKRKTRMRRPDLDAAPRSLLAVKFCQYRHNLENKVVLCIDRKSVV